MNLYYNLDNSSIYLVLLYLTKIRNYMKKVLLACVGLGIAYNINAQVGIGTSSVDESAILEVTSSSKGFLPPRLTTVQRRNISSPSAGLIVYNTDNNCIQFYTGTDWYDPCCKNSVDNGIDAFNFLIRIDPTAAAAVTKMNTADGTSAGVDAANNDYVYKLTSSAAGAQELIYTAGTSEQPANGHDVFQYTTTTNPIDYKATTFISRTKAHSGNTISRLQYDFTTDHQAPFDLFLVGRMDSSTAPFNNYGSFFSSSNASGNNYSFQLGVGNSTSSCTNDYYTIVYKKTGSTSFLCGPGGIGIEANDGNLHTFNINCSDNPTDGGATKVFSLYVDGQLMQSDSTLTDYMTIDMLRMFSNRATSSGVQSDVSEILVFDDVLTAEERATLNTYLTCKYSD